MTDSTVGVSACKHCGAELPAPSGSGGRPRLYCSLRCKRGRPPLTGEPKPDPIRVSGDSLDKTCTRDGCDRPLRARGLCARDWKQEYGKRTTYTIVCAVCEVEHQSTRPDGKYCSDACKGARLSEQGAGPHCKIPTTHPAHPHWAGRLLPAIRTKPTLWLRTSKLMLATQMPKPRRWYAGQCQRCDTWFVFDQPANRYCSTRCGRRDAKDRRRAAQREAFVAPVYRARIFKRDGWCCQLCGKAAKRDEVVPHPLAPVIDHVIPLARGGTHEPANAQCAHFMCNSIKSDRGGGEQLALIG